MTAPAGQGDRMRAGRASASADFLYAYDAAGHFEWPDFASADRLELLGAELDRLRWAASSFPYTHRVDDLVGKSAPLGELARELFLADWLHAAMTYPHRLIESYALERFRGGKLPLHGGAGERLTRAGYPESEDVSCSYSFRSGRMYSFRAKALLYLDDVERDADGPLTYIEGSHKANFPFMQTYAAGSRGVGDHDNLTRRILVSAGTLVLLNEAVVHGAMEKQSEGRRRVVVFTFAPSFARDWSELARGDAHLTRMGYVVPDTEDSH